MVKKPNGVAKATAASADAVAGPSKANPSTPGSIKATKFKKRRVKVNRQKPAAAAAAADKVGAGTGDGDASASAVLLQPSNVAEASPVVETPKSTTFAEASPVAQTQEPVTDAEGSVPAPMPASAEASVSAPKPQPDNDEAPASAPKPKPATDEAAASAPKPKPATDEAAASAPKPKPAHANADAAAAAAISASKGKGKVKGKGKGKGKGAGADNSGGESALAPKPKPAHANADADAAAAISASKGKGKDAGADNTGGDSRMESRKERTRSGKGKEIREDGGSKGKAKGKKAVGKKEERGDHKVAGFIFMCNAKTKKECYQNRVFGMPSGKIEMVKKIRPGVKLFLYDFDLKLLYGVYKAASHGGLNLAQEAFNGKFPAQVKFKIDKDCRPLPESSLKQAIKENYSARSKFDPELTTRQVQRLLLLFKPVNAPQSVPNSRLEERRHYEERRKPYHRFEERRSSPIEEVRQPRFDDERRHAAIHVPLDDPYRAPRFAPLPVESQRDHSWASVQGDHHRYYQPALAPEPRHIPLVLEPRYVPLGLDHHHVRTVPELRHVPTAYRTLAPSGDSYYRSVENLVPERYADRTVADVNTRDPIIREHAALPGEAYARGDRLDDFYRTRGAHAEEMYRPGEIAAHADRVGIATRADRVEELYRSDRLINRALDLPPHSTYPAAAYETNPAYAEANLRPVPARVSGPSAPVSTLYSFTGGSVYR